jgi:Zn-dependent oligopeptidase
MMNDYNNNNLWAPWAIGTGECIIDEINTFITKSVKTNIDIIKNEDDTKFIQKLSDDFTMFSIYHSNCFFFQFVSPNRNIRSFCNQGDIILTKYNNELNMNSNIFNKILKYQRDNCNKISDNDNLFLKKIIDNYENKGSNINSANKHNFIKTKLEISKIEQKIIKHVFPTIILNVKQIHGIPPNLLKLFKYSNNKYYVLLVKSNYVTCMNYIHNENVRKYIENIFTRACEPLLYDISRLFVLRDKCAKMLNNNNYSEYKIKNQIINQTEDIKGFLTSLSHKFDSQYLKEISTLKSIKKQIYGDDIINSWDVNYLTTQWKKQYGVNGLYIQECFVFEHVFREILLIFQEIFNIKFVLIHEDKLWHDDVIVYNVFDNNPKHPHNHLVKIYFDLWKRDNKISLTKIFFLQHPCKFKGVDIIPIAAFVSNFIKADIVNVNHSDIVTIFREFTNIIYLFFSRNDYSLLSGLNKSNDFEKLPSYIVENLCWDKNILKRLSNNKLDDDIIDKMKKVKNINIGLYVKKQIYISLFDLLVNSSSNFIDVCESIICDKNISDKNSLISKTFGDIMRELFSNIVCYNLTMDKKFSVIYNNDSLIPLSWINLIASNSGLYHNYLWNFIYSIDIFNDKFHDDHHNNLFTFGKDLIDNIFVFGNTLSSDLILDHYLKRKLNIDGFLNFHNIHINSFYFNTEYLNNNTLVFDTDTEYYSKSCAFNEVYVNTLTEDNSNIDSSIFIKKK